MATDSSAVRAIAEAGYALDQLAGLSGIPAAELMAELVGRRGFSDATLDALRGILSPHLAEEIAALAGSARAAYLEEVQIGRL